MIPTIQRLPLARIRIDGGTQTRVGLDEPTVTEYAEALASGGKFPPILVFFDGTDYWMADGFHRYHAHGRAQLAEIECEIREGTKRAALLFSVGANAAHGLRRTNADKRRAVEILLNDPDWCRWSDREIARRCAVSHPFVMNVRRGLSGNGYQMEASRERTFIRHGTVSTMNTSALGSKCENVSRADPNESPTTDQRLDENLSLSVVPENRTVLEAEEAIHDELGRPIPAELNPVFQAVRDFRLVLHRLALFRKAVQELSDKPGGAYLRSSSILNDLDYVQQTIRWATPLAVCPQCEGAVCSTGTDLCGGHGWLSDGSFESLPPEWRRKAEAWKPPLSENN